MPMQNTVQHSAHDCLAGSLCGNFICDSRNRIHLEGAVILDKGEHIFETDFTLFDISKVFRFVMSGHTDHRHNKEEKCNTHINHTACGQHFIVILIAILRQDYKCDNKAKDHCAERAMNHAPKAHKRTL